MKYGYDIIDEKGILWADSGDMLFDTKDENDRLNRRISLFRQTTKTRKSLHLTLISPFGATHNQYWNNLQSEITIDALFV